MADCKLRVRLTPRSGHERIDSYMNGILRARVSAPPVDGAANTALIELLSDTLDIRKSAIRIQSGASSREKLIAIEGMDEETLKLKLKGVIL